MMLTPAERAAKRAAWLGRIRREIERRQALAFRAEGGDVRGDFLEKLKEMGERLRSVPGYVPPTPAQQRRVGQKLDRRFKRHGYGLGE
ncbi:MAG TPA: hypothetical protein VNW89_13055 [Stellaceae bacterium]|jgi:hypothetical protein|nr:hypothetical protein [Stellaceae bacterium]